MMSLSVRAYNLLSAAAAFFAWGGWAFYVNSRQDMMTGLVSGLSQGALSFAITLIVVVIITRIYRALEPGRWRNWLPAILVVSALAIIMSIAHRLVGTPHILLTIAPSLSMTFFFCVFTSYRLARTPRDSER